MRLKEKKIDPLRDARIAERLREIDMEQHCVQPWSFGRKGEKEEQLKSIVSIAINTKGQFIVGDESTVKVFDRRGNFLYSFSPPECNNYIKCVAVDQADNMYVLDRDDAYHTVYVFDAQAKLDHSFRVNTGRRGYSLMVDCSGNVLMWMRDRRRTTPSRTFEPGEVLTMEVFSNSGDRLSRIGVSCGDAFDCLCTTSKGRLFVLDWHDHILHSISIEDNSDHEKKPIQLEEKTSPIAMKFHQASEHFFILSSGYGRSLSVSIYNKDFDCVRTIPLNVSTESFGTSAFAVNNSGQIVVQIMSNHRHLVSVV